MSTNALQLAHCGFHGSLPAGWEQSPRALARSVSRRSPLRHAEGFKDPASLIRSPDLQGASRWGLCYGFSLTAGVAASKVPRTLAGDPKKRDQTATDGWMGISCSGSLRSLRTCFACCTITDRKYPAESGACWGVGAGLSGGSVACMPGSTSACNTLPPPQGKSRLSAGSLLPPPAQSWGDVLHSCS
jgi:hypothetical protein